MKTKRYWSLLVVGFIVSSITLYKTRDISSIHITDHSSVERKLQTASFLNFNRKLPVQFTANSGQFIPQVRYYTKSAGHAVLFGTNTVTFRNVVENTSDKEKVETSEFTLHFLGANEKAGIQGIDETGGRSNYYLGDNSKHWKDNVPGYHAIQYHNLYDGIDLDYRVNNNKLKSTFYLDAGRSPDAIRLQYTGTGPLKITRDGSLELKTFQGKIIDSPPLVYQTDEHNKRIILKARYKLFDKNTYGFEIEDIDPALPLVIDPQLGYSGTFGGSNTDYVTDMVLDIYGNIYAVGTTFSDDYPTKNAAYPNQPTGPSYMPENAFVTKFNPVTNEIIYSTYLGGNDNYESGTAIALDEFGNVYVLGLTTSKDFPTMNAYQDSLNGYSNDFIVKLDSSGQLVSSTYFGGPWDFGCKDICLDKNKNIWIVGSTTGAGFPVMDPLQSYGGGTTDGFVAQFDNSISSMLFATPFGGSAADYFTCIVPDDSGNVYIGGNTYSPDFPLHNETQTMFAGGTDAVAVKLKVSDKSLFFSSFFGGSDFETVKDIAVDKKEDIFITGSTASMDLPLHNAVQDSAGGGNDIYISAWYYMPDSAKYSNKFSTYYGGSGDDNPSKLGVMNFNSPDSSLSLVVAGKSGSPNLAKVDSINQAYSPPFYGFTGCIALYNNLRRPDLGVKLSSSSLLYPFRSVDALTVNGNTVTCIGDNKDTLSSPTYNVLSYIFPALSIKKEANYDTIAIGNVVKFRIAVKNISPIKVKNVVVSDYFDTACYTPTWIDTGYSFIDTVGAKIRLTHSSGDLNPSEKVYVYVDMKTKMIGICKNTAFAASDNTPVVSDTASVLVVSLNATINKTADKDTVKIGDTVTYTLTMKNTGDLPITDPYITENYLTNLQHFIKVTGAKKLRTYTSIDVPHSKFLYCYVDAMQPGESRSVKITFRVLEYDNFFGRIVPDEAWAEDYATDYSNGPKSLGIVGTAASPSLSKILSKAISGDDAKKSARTGQPVESMAFNNMHIYVDSIDAGKLSGVDSGTVVNNFDLWSAAPYIHIAPAGDTAILNPVYTRQFDFYTGDPSDSTFHLPTAYQLLIPDYTDSAMVILKRDWRKVARDQSKVDFYIAHAVDNGETYNIDLAGMNTNVATGLQFGQVSDYTSVAPGTYTLEIRNSSDELLASMDLDLSNDAGRSLTMILAPTDSTISSGIGIKIYGASNVDSIWTLVGTSIATTIDQATAGQKVYLSYRYTNPITIDFTLPEAGLATIKVYDLNGREVATLTHKFYNPGSYSVPFNTTGLPAGIYIYRLVTNGVEKSNKIMIRHGQ